MKHTKIVATIGPSSESKEMLRRLVESGMNVARLNFSHNEHSWHKEVINRIREVGEELGVPVAILADLQGPRIRIAAKADLPVSLGQRIRFTDVSRTGMLGEWMGETVVLDAPGVAAGIDPGDRILIEDGTLRARAVEKGDGYAVVEMESGGVIRPHKGVNLPDTDLKLPILSDKDVADLSFVLKEGVDFVGLSFVGSGEDVASAREEMRLMRPEGARLPAIVSKIERKEAIANLTAILKETDVVMVARGDLGIEMPAAEIGILQKDIIRQSLSAVRPVIVATQMMKSMTDHPSPTRAEVSDVTNAVVDHADAVMLSEETAMGSYPVETVSMMREIVERTEESPFDDVYDALDTNIHSEYAAIIRSVYELAKSFEARAILLLSMSGFTARLASHFRPDRDILVATDDAATWRELALVWGVVPYLFVGDRETFLDRLVERAVKEGRLAPGDHTVVFLGRVPGEHDMMRLVGIREIK